tara:strand:- start:764 stop:1111 length:348 start_codon:yes stop_codon:yes gene_type:complete
MAISQNITVPTKKFVDIRAALEKGRELAKGEDPENPDKDESPEVKDSGTGAGAGKETTGTNKETERGGVTTEVADMSKDLLKPEGEDPGKTKMGKLLSTIGTGVKGMFKGTKINK